MTLGIVEEADLDRLHHRLGTHDPGTAEALRLGQCGLHVGYADIEGGVSRIALRALADAAPDALTDEDVVSFVVTEVVSLIER